MVAEKRAAGAEVSVVSEKVLASVDGPEPEPEDSGGQTEDNHGTPASSHTQSSDMQMPILMIRTHIRRMRSRNLSTSGLARNLEQEHGHHHGEAGVAQHVAEEAGLEVKAD